MQITNTMYIIDNRLLAMNTKIKTRTRTGAIGPLKRTKRATACSVQQSSTTSTQRSNTWKRRITLTFSTWSPSGVREIQIFRSQFTHTSPLTELDFYGCIKLINYARKQVREERTWSIFLHHRGIPTQTKRCFRCQTNVASIAKNTLILLNCFDNTWIKNNITKWSRVARFGWTHSMSLIDQPLLH